MLEMDTGAQRHGRARSMAARCKELLITASQGIPGDQNKPVVGPRLEAIFKNAWELNIFYRN